MRGVFVIVGTLQKKRTYVVGLLDDWTVGDWVTEWDTEFNDVGTACL